MDDPLLRLDGIFSCDIKNVETNHDSYTGEEMNEALSLNTQLQYEDSCMSNKIAHLQMIQGVINRLSTNSFLLKGWSVVLISAIFAFAKGGNYSFLIISYFPALVFWGLDGYFLYEERIFRKVYDHVRKLTEDEIDFSMKISCDRGEIDSWLSVTRSKTIVAFHGVILISITLSILISFIIKLRTS